MEIFNFLTSTKSTKLTIPNIYDKGVQKETHRIGLRLRDLFPVPSLSWVNQPFDPTLKGVVDISDTLKWHVSIMSRDEEARVFTAGFDAVQNVVVTVQVAVEDEYHWELRKDKA